MMHLIFDDSELSRDQLTGIVWVDNYHAFSWQRWRNLLWTHYVMDDWGGSLCW